MKKFNVKVNSIVYEVEVEEITGNDVAEVKKEVSNEVKKTVSQGIGEKVKAPMPGTILKVNVKNGDIVKKGDVLFVLEAMKMENEIKSTIEGNVVSVGVAQGDSVNTGDMLVEIE